MGNKAGAWMRLLVIGCVAVPHAGCSIFDYINNPFTVPVNANGKPTIWQCTLVKMATPAEYACPDGKTYTASQLRDFRLGTEAPNVNSK
jgi:hypothetical protein